MSGKDESVPKTMYLPALLFSLPLHPPATLRNHLCTYSNESSVYLLLYINTLPDITEHKRTLSHSPAYEAFSLMRET